jgi:alginate O-acetyltransferase complex protein AlgI
VTLTHILIFICIGILVRFARQGRAWLLLSISALAVFWLQPALPVRFLDFWLPAVTLTLAGLSWLVTSTPEVRTLKENWIAVGVLGGVVLLAGLTRFLPEPLLTASRPPQLGVVAAGLVLAAAAALLLWLARRKTGDSLAAGLPGGLIVVLLGLFLLIKIPAAAAWTSAGLRLAVGQSAALASAVDLRWLGFSYLAFRLIHTARDRQSGRLPAVSLREYVTYAIFFPALTAGPIDRLERFIKDLRRPCSPNAPDLAAAGQRLAVGLFKKFVVADALALIALNGTNASQVHSTGWMWVLVYAYAFQIFFDFSGYTDIAIGLGILMGIKLPENFNAPYLKPNLTQFWNNWHMTLTQWFRAYFFNPVTRWLRSPGLNPAARGWLRRPLSIPLVILTTQLSTMVLIGLWHGVTWNFVAWGAWHGLGMFFQNRYSEAARSRLPVLEGWRASAVNGLGVLLTFHFVALGWVWFALPTPALSWSVLGKLFGG